MLPQLNSRYLHALPLLFAGNHALAQDSDRGTLASPELWEPLLRMGLSLVLVLVVLGGCVWLAKRLRHGGGFQGGLIQIISGISLGGRDKVVLLRVGEEEILVGVSPAGMRPLHVMPSKAEPKQFEEFMEQTQTLERRS